MNNDQIKMIMRGKTVFPLRLLESLSSLKSPSFDLFSEKQKNKKKIPEEQ